jgi:hypothetical protein
MTNTPEDALTKLQKQEAALRAKFDAQRQSLLATEAKRKAAQKQWQEGRWQALGQVVEACLGTQVTVEELRVRLEQSIAVEREETGTP